VTRARRGLWLLGLAALAPQPARAVTVHGFVEPFQASWEQLDAVHAVSGLQSRSAVRLGGGLGMTLGPHCSVALVAGTAAGTTDFGLLSGPAARLVRTDAALELRGRLPRTWQGFGVQAALGAGRLSFGYRPDRIALDVEGMPVVVDLPPVRAWTRQAAAEVLHAVPGGELGLRCAWRFYDLDVSTPGGVVTHAARDLQLGMLVRITVF
jgi:hypothetical protein